MKIYAVISKITEKSVGHWEIISWFSLEKEKCEKYLKDTNQEQLEIREYESETSLENFHQAKW
jgi:hypothetical protein